MIKISRRILRVILSTYKSTVELAIVADAISLIERAVTFSFASGVPLPTAGTINDAESSTGQSIDFIRVIRKISEHSVSDLELELPFAVGLGSDRKSLLLDSSVDV